MLGSGFEGIFKGTSFNQRVFCGFARHLRSEMIQFFGNLSNPYVNTVLIGK